MIAKDESLLPVTANAAKCLTCGTIVWSTHRHDWQACECPDGYDNPSESTRIFVDGGDDYRRFGWGAKAKWDDWYAGQWQVGGRNGTPIEMLPDKEAVS